MRVVEINSTNFGSTGGIMLHIAEAARARGHEVLTCCPKSRSNAKKQPEHQLLIGNRVLRNLHILLGRYTGLQGCFSALSTFRFLRKIKRFQPDVIHLHNLHSDYINLPMLFGYIKRHSIKTVWTLHDCWAFTGHCPHFTMTACGKWKSGCHHCPSYKEYPASALDNAAYMYRLKKRWFTGVEDMTIVTPSRWLAELVKQSYLRDYPVEVIHNGIDLAVFKPTESRFREEHGIAEDQYMLLGVAFGWGEGKGLDVFVELSRRLDARFQIVLVGTDETVDRQLPENIVAIHRTQNQRELAEIYTAADLFVNPTREDTYPTVNMEALACATPVLTFRTGGSPECIDETCGSVVDCDDVDAMEREIVRICEERPYARRACVEHGSGFENEKVFARYLDLYDAAERI